MAFYYFRYLAALLNLHFFQTKKIKYNLWNDDNFVLVSALMKTGNSHYQQTKVKI